MVTAKRLLKEEEMIKFTGKLSPFLKLFALLLLIVGGLTATGQSVLI